MASNIESTVCFFKDLYKTLTAISKEDAGILMTALFAEANGEEPDFCGSVIASALYPMASDQMRRLEEFRRKKANRSKTEQKVANESKTEQTVAPYPYPNPYPNNIQRNPKIQRSMGFSTERTDVDYNEIARRMREEREAAE